MTVQEAIEDVLTLCDLCTFSGECMSCSICYEAVPMAIEALEKQIPKNAVVLDKVYDEVRSCPACGKDTVYHGRTFFCCKCGQALDWGE